MFIISYRSILSGVGNSEYNKDVDIVNELGLCCAVETMIMCM